LEEETDVSADVDYSCDQATANYGGVRDVEMEVKGDNGGDSDDNDDEMDDGDSNAMVVMEYGRIQE
jgi:hypothetical protein